MAKLCPDCGAINDDNEVFCQKCGLDLENVAPNGGGVVPKPEPGPEPQPPLLEPKLVITAFKGRSVSGEMILQQGENILGREDIAAATNNALDEGDYLHVSRKEKGGHVEIRLEPPDGGVGGPPDSLLISVKHISQRAGVKTTVNGVGIEGKGMQILKDGDKIVLNDAFELIFKLR